MSATAHATEGILDTAPRGNRILHYLELSRIYTWPDMAATGLLGVYFVRPHPDWVVLSQVGVLSISLWIVLNWFSEYQQRDWGRIPPPLCLTAVPLTISVAIVVGLNSAAAGFLFAYLGFVWLYPLKKRNRWVAAGCFFIRGMHTACLFLLAANLSGPLGGRIWEAALGLFLLQSSRSLVAEVRDASFDEFGLPAELARILRPPRAQAIVLLFSLALAVAAASILKLSVAIPVGLVFGVALIWQLVIPEPLPVASYRVHSWLITASAVAKVALGLPGFSSIVTIGLLSLLSNTLGYHRVYRPINDMIARSARTRSATVRFIC